MIGPPVALERTMKVRHASVHRRKVRLENPARLSLIRRVVASLADRADQETKTLLMILLV
jgi:hypothetical protein